MSLQVIFLSVLLSLFCFGNSFTITGTKDGEYEGFDYQDVEIASTATKCYFKATLEGCKKGKKLNTILLRESKKDKKERSFTTVVESTSVACLEARCINNALSHKVEIGGEGEIDTPDVLEKGYKGIHSSRADCMRSGSAAIKITCKTTGTDINSNTGKKITEIEEYDPEIPDGIIENAEMMKAESQDSVIPDGEDQPPPLAKVWEEDKGDNNDEDDNEEDNEDIDKETEDKIAAEFEEQFARAEDQSEVMTENAVMAENGGMTARIQFNNWFRGCLYASCGNRQGLYHALSGFSSHYLDRIWRFSCKQASDYNFNHCYWTGYQNSFDWPLMVQCGHNYIMNGIYAYYSSHHRDRRFSLLCCRASYHYTRTCGLSGYINGWHGWMNYGVGGHQRVFTGVFSFHHNGYEDRVWKMQDCYYRR